MYSAFDHWAYWSQMLTVISMFLPCTQWVFGPLSPVSPALAPDQVTPTPQPSANDPNVISALGGALSLATSLPDGSPTPEFHPLPVHPRSQNPVTPSTLGTPSDAAHSESSAASSLTLSSTAEEPERPLVPKPTRVTGR